MFTQHSCAPLSRNIPWCVGPLTTAPRHVLYSLAQWWSLNYLPSRCYLHLHLHLTHTHTISSASISQRSKSQRIIIIIVIQCLTVTGIWCHDLWCLTLTSWTYFPSFPSLLFYSSYTHHLSDFPLVAGLAVIQLYSAYSLLKCLCSNWPECCVSHKQWGAVGAPALGLDYSGAVMRRPLKTGLLLCSLGVRQSKALTWKVSLRVQRNSRLGVQLTCLGTGNSGVECNLRQVRLPIEIRRKYHMGVVKQYCYNTR